MLGDLPYVGTLFSRVQYTQEEQEMVILVTPHLVDGMDCRQAPKRLPGRETRAPDDYELFLEGILEAPRGQRQVFENGRYKAAYKNDPSYQRFPCADPLPREPHDKGGFRHRGADNCGPGCGVPGGYSVIPGAAANPAPGANAGMAANSGMLPATPVETIPGVPTTAGPLESRSSPRRSSPAIPLPDEDR